MRVREREREGKCNLLISLVINFISCAPSDAAEKKYSFGLIARRRRSPRAQSDDYILLLGKCCVKVP
jgi:hypothetical protein